MLKKVGVFLYELSAKQWEKIKDLVPSTVGGREKAGSDNRNFVLVKAHQQAATYKYSISSDNPCSGAATYTPIPYLFDKYPAAYPAATAAMHHRAILPRCSLKDCGTMRIVSNSFGPIMTSMSNHDLPSLSPVQN